MIKNHINFDITFKIKSNWSGQSVKVSWDKDFKLVRQHDTLQIDLDKTITDESQRIELLDFSGISPSSDGHIEIEEMTINGYTVPDFEHYLSFDMTANNYVKNETKNLVCKIYFNGKLYLDVSKHKDRFFWHNSFSDTKDGLVVVNTALECKSDYGCWGGPDCDHLEKKTFQYNDLVTEQDYGLVAIGCSVTAGTGVIKTKTWPYNIGQKGPVLNLAMTGMGADAMLQNTKAIIDKKLKFDRIIILLSSLGRKLLRIKKYDKFFYFLLGHTKSHSEEWNIYFKKQDINKTLDIAIERHLRGNYEQRSKKMIKKIIRMLQKQQVNYYISSWHNDTYEYLKTVTGKDRLLPKFNEEDDQTKGIDGQHPSEKIHYLWTQKIKNKIK